MRDGFFIVLSWAFLVQSSSAQETIPARDKFSPRTTGSYSIDSYVKRDSLLLDLAKRMTASFSAKQMKPGGVLGGTTFDPSALTPRERDEFIWEIRKHDILIQPAALARYRYFGFDFLEAYRLLMRTLK